MRKNFFLLIKKYPMSFLLAIIALNLFSIAGSLKTSAKLDSIRLICLEDNDVIERKLGKYNDYKCNILNN